MADNKRKEQVSRAYLEYIKACSTLLSMIQAELCLAKARYDEGELEVLNSRKEHYSQEIERAEGLIGFLDESLADVLRRQYIEGQSQERIAEEKGYVVRTIQRFTKDGRAELYEHLPVEFR